MTNTDPRLEAAAKAHRETELPATLSWDQREARRFIAMHDALRAFDHAQQATDRERIIRDIQREVVRQELNEQHQSEVVPHSGTVPSVDNATAPVIGAKLDPKFYGEVRKVKDDSVVPEDEYVVFLVKDNAFAAILPQYRAKCVELGCDADQIQAIDRMIGRAEAWRSAHPERLKNPDAAGEKLLDTPTMTTPVMGTNPPWFKTCAEQLIDLGHFEGTIGQAEYIIQAVLAFANAQLPSEAEIEAATREIQQRVHDDKFTEEVCARIARAALDSAAKARSGV